MNSTEFEEVDLIQHIEEYLTINKTVYETLTTEDISNIRLPLSNLNSGKGFRQLLLLSLIEYMNLEVAPQGNEIKAILGFIDILHDSSLLIDDIEDSSLERRGEKCAYIQYGTALTLNCGTYGIFEALDGLIEYMDEEHDSFSDKKKYDILKSLNNEIMHLHIGQGLEIFWRDISLKVPDFDNYLKMIRLKTSGMLRILALLFIEFFDIKEEKEIVNITRLMDYIGIVYQIRDDYLNIIAVNSTDIHEGKFSFPILLGINKELKENDNRSVIYDLVTKKHKLDKDLEIVLSRLKEYGFLDISVTTVNDLIDQIITAFELKQESALAYLLNKIKIGK